MPPIQTRLFLYSLSAAILLVLLAGNSASRAADYDLASDYDARGGYPLQKSQFGVSYAGTTNIDISFNVLRARHGRNNDKRLRASFEGFDNAGDPIYTRQGAYAVIGMLEAAADTNAIGDTNIQGPIEHPSAETYRLSPHLQNEWNWPLFANHTAQYYDYLRAELDAHGPTGSPFVFGLGHEPNNDANADQLGLDPNAPLDGVAFMGPLEEFRDLVIEQGNSKGGDIIQANNYFIWYRQVIDLLRESYGDRSQFLISAPHVHTSSTTGSTYLPEFRRLIDETDATLAPDFIGCHSRTNPIGDNRFFNAAVLPARTIFNSSPRWLATPIMCNEFGISDTEPRYQDTLLGAVSLLTQFERILESPDVGYVNFNLNRRFVSPDGTELYPAFHAFRFYQEMPQRRTTVSGDRPADLHVLASMAAHGEHAALLWRDGIDRNTTYTVDFTLNHNSPGLAVARAYLYVISAGDIEQPEPTSPNSADLGLKGYLAAGFPKTISGRENIENYTFPDISLPPGSIAMLKLVGLDDSGNEQLNQTLINPGPTGARLVRAHQWTARTQTGIDPSWGFADTVNWTLFAGINSLAGSEGSGRAYYLDDARVKRGLAGIEYRSAGPNLELSLLVDGGNFNPVKTDTTSLAAVRIDFYNGDTGTYDASVYLAGNRAPQLIDYQDDVPWGHGGEKPDIIPQKILYRHVQNGADLVLNLDDFYTGLTGRASAADFIAGGRRIIVSALVENTIGGLTVTLGDNTNGQATPIYYPNFAGLAKSLGYADPTMAAFIDGDHDGLNLLFEYALGGDPQQPDRADVSPKFTLSFNGPDTVLKYHHRERTDDPTLHYQIFWSNDLLSNGWMPLPTDSAIQHTPDANRPWVTVITWIKPTSERIFLRLAVTQLDSP